MKQIIFEQVNLLTLSPMYYSLSPHIGNNLKLFFFDFSLPSKKTQLSLLTYPSFLK